MSKISECQNCNRDGHACICPVVKDEEGPRCKDLGGQVWMNGECLLCTAEAGESCR